MFVKRQNGGPIGGNLGLPVRATDHVCNQLSWY